MHGKGSLYNKAKQFLVTGIFNYGILFKSNCRKILEDGSYYVGPLDEKLNPHGLGEFVKNQNDKYLGEFLSGVPDGMGTETKKYGEFIG